MRNLKIFILTFITIILVGCGYTSEEKKLIKQYEKKGKENAINYIKNKYGFTAKVKDVDVDKVDTSPIPDLSPSPNGKAYIEMEYNSKEFYVYINCEDNSLDGLDNYQFDNIAKDLLNEIKKDTLIDPYAYSIVYGIGEYGSKNGLISEYYDGTNLSEILSSNHTKLTIDYINNINLEKFKNTETLGILNSVAESSLINFKSIDSYEESVAIEGLYSDSDLKNNALNIDNAIYIDVTRKYYKFNINEFDGIYFGDLDTNQSVNLVFGEIDNIDIWDGHGSSKPTQVSSVYSIDTQAEKIYVYLPIEKFEKYEAHNLDLAVQCDKNGERKYYTSFVNKIENLDYYVSNVDLKGCINTKITVLKSNYN